MKLSKKNRAMLSGVLVGLASIGAVASYFDLNRDELSAFLFASVLFVFGILVLAAVTVVVFKLGARVLRRISGSDQPGSSDRE